MTIQTKVETLKMNSSSFSTNIEKQINVLLFVYSTLAGFSIRIIGMLPLNEILSMILLPIFFLKDKGIMRRYPDARKVIICFIFYGSLGRDAER